MYASMGLDAGAAWADPAEANWIDRLGHDVACFVVDDPARPGGLCASACGLVSTRLPSPQNPSGRVGYIMWVATDESWRRRGLSAAVMTALLDLFRRQDVVMAELHATAAGERVYRRLGFDEGANPALRRRL
jgi:GNAT superfamily N-acetyltransferase